MESKKTFELILSSLTPEQVDYLIHCINEPKKSAVENYKNHEQELAENRTETEKFKKTNILEEANKIVNNRSEEKDRQYGSFGDSMDKMRDIFNSMTGLKLQTRHMFIAIVALKFSREMHKHKEDNLLDAVAYLGALNNYIENEEKKTKL